MASLQAHDPLKLLLQNLSLFSQAPGGGGDSAYKRGRDARRLSLRGVNCGFWSHLECSGQNAIIFSREGLV